MTAPKTGDTVKLTRGYDATSVEGVVTGAGYVADRSLRDWERYGYTATVTKPAPVPIPTRRGVYVDRDGDVWVHSSDGWALVAYNNGHPAAELANADYAGLDDAARFAPFTRIEKGA